MVLMTGPDRLRPNRPRVFSARFARLFSEWYWWRWEHWTGSQAGPNLRAGERETVQVQASVYLGSGAPAALFPLGTSAGENASLWTEDTKPNEQWFGLETLPLDKSETGEWFSKFTLMASEWPGKDEGRFPNSGENRCFSSKRKKKKKRTRWRI